MLNLKTILGGSIVNGSFFNSYKIIDKFYYITNYFQAIKIKMAGFQHKTFLKGSGYFTIDGNLPLESILP